MNVSPVHPACVDPDQLLKACDTRRSRASGPGGQNRNKVETAIVLTHPPTGITGSASERRSQLENQRVALFRLRVNLALEVRQPREPHANLTPLWQSRITGGRIACNSEHDDFPAMLAEALDAIFANTMDMVAAADSLHVTSSQLVKLLKAEPRALRVVNTRRGELGLPPLR